MASVDTLITKHLEVPTSPLKVDKFKRATLKITWTAPATTEADRIFTGRFYVEPREFRQNVRFVIPPTNSLDDKRPIFYMNPDSSVAIQMHIEEGVEVPSNFRIELYCKRVAEIEQPEKYVSAWRTATESLPVAGLHRVDLRFELTTRESEGDSNVPGKIAKGAGPSDAFVETGPSDAIVETGPSASAGQGGFHVTLRKVLFIGVAIACFMLFCHLVIKPWMDGRHRNGNRFSRGNGNGHHEF